MLLAAALASGSLPAQETGVDTPELVDCRIRAAEGFPGIKARCGTLARPEDPSDPDSPVLALHFAVVPALSLEPDRDPFVPIAGGPGQATTRFYASYSAAFEDVRRTRDILLLDQRGTGDSASMQCQVDEDLIEGAFSRERTVAEARACLDALPYDPRFFTTSVAVEDLEALRVALGYTQFNVYGISYGSRVAQHFLRRYPESTRSVIIDGVVPPQIALGPGIAIEAQNALDAIFDRCAESEACHERFPTVREDFADLRAFLAEQDVSLYMANPVTGTREEVIFDDNRMAGALRMLSYHPSSVALMPLLIDEAVNGNFQPLAAQFLMVAESMQDQLSVGMHNAVVCTEDSPYFEGEAVTRDALAATYIGPLQLEALEAICSVWPKGVLDDDFKTPVASSVPVLLLSGEADPITPPAYADLAAVDLENALHLIGKDQGHGQAPQGCMPRIVGRFVETASVRDLDTGCLDKLFAMPFFLDFSGPAP
jgi:pimeloyl-ACP methyl ester carboxylesterase